MIRYNPYKSDKPNKDSLLNNITLQQMIIKRFNLVLLVILILLFIKMKQENKDISIDIRKLNIKIGINQELIHLVLE
jgi:hypothetical protein